MISAEIKCAVVEDLARDLPDYAVTAAQRAFDQSYSNRQGKTFDVHIRVAVVAALRAIVQKTR